MTSRKLGNWDGSWDENWTPAPEAWPSSSSVLLIKARRHWTVGLGVDGNAPVHDRKVDTERHGPAGSAASGSFRLAECCEGYPAAELYETAPGFRSMLGERSTGTAGRSRCCAVPVLEQARSESCEVPGASPRSHFRRASYSARCGGRLPRPFSPPCGSLAGSGCHWQRRLCLVG